MRAFLLNEFMSENKGWIKLHRSLLDWQWFEDHNTTRLLIYLLVSVNYESKKWKGQKINEGELITSNSKLASAVGLSVQNIRSSLNKLKIDNQITIKSTNKFQLITLVKWGELQNKDEATNKQKEPIPTNKQQTNNNQTTTTKEGKELKEIKNKEFLLKKETKKDSLKKANEIILPFETPTFEKAWNDWKQYKEIELKFRYKSIISEAMALTELKKLSRNLEKTAIEIIYQSITNGWKGLFELKNQTNGNTTSNTKPTAQQQLAEINARMEAKINEAFKNAEH